MDNDNIDGGKKIPIQQDRSAVEPVAGSRIQRQMGDQNPLTSRRAGAHTAMSQQSSESGRGTECLPQKLVHLVGHRDPKASGESWVRPRLPVQR